MTESELLEKIHNVFCNVPLPEPMVDDQLDASILNSVLEGKKWQDLTPKLALKVFHYGTALNLDGFRYFLPGFMVCSITDEAAMDVAVNAILDALRPPKAQKGIAWETFQNFANHFSQSESEVVYNFLQLFEKRRSHELRHFESSPNLARSAFKELAAIRRSINFWSTLASGMLKCSDRNLT